MTLPSDEPSVHGYDAFYAEFDSPLMRQLRREAFGEDIGQHSWVTSGELLADVPRLNLDRSSRLLDLGCGPAGPLTFIAGAVGCRTTGIDVSAAALASGRERASGLGLSGLVTLREGDLDEPLPFSSGSFDAVMSVDAILHARDRAATFREVGRLLLHGGRFLFTDAGVVTGPLSADEVARRSVFGPTRFVPQGFNERLLEEAGFRFREAEDRTPTLLTSAANRLAARRAHRAELVEIEGAETVARQEEYLETVAALAAKRSLSRFMYLAERVRS